MLAGKLAPKHVHTSSCGARDSLALLVKTANASNQHEELRFCLCADQLLVCCVQIINISSTLGSISTLQRSLDAEEGSFPATLSHYHLAYRSSKAALNMRKHPTNSSCGHACEGVSGMSSGASLETAITLCSCLPFFGFCDRGQNADLAHTQA